MINLRNVRVSELWSMFMFFFWNLLFFFSVLSVKITQSISHQEENRLLSYYVFVLYFPAVSSNMYRKHIHIIDFLSANNNRFSAASASPAMSAKEKLICYLINVMSEFFLEYAVEYSRYYNLLSLFWLRISC